ncbi:MAG: HWE histidine kinase domain-containing protein [Parasphingorhabdus sp.]|uniref:sensor histidine kinase n=1 Tax=Parasphingorhabdus sp. TaxID=2709688 RepID=UPI0030030D89
MDSAPEVAFDRITRLCADIFKAPMASISFVDADRQWFKSAVGIKSESTARDISFCSHVVDGQEPLVVEDTAKSGFRDNPLVIGEPYIRFYAGAPLIAPDGMVLGSFWIGDTEPRARPTDSEIQHLRDFSDLVISEMELRREMALREKAQRQAAQNRTDLELTLALSNTSSFRIDLESGHIEWGGAYMKIWGEDAGEKLADLDSAMARIHEDDRDAVVTAMSAAANLGEKYEATFRIVLPSEEIRWIEGFGDHLLVNGRPTLTGLNKDVTNSVQTEDQLRLHTRELHHRLRNLFSTLQSIMTLTKKSATSIDDYMERISSRLRALNRAQQILLDTNFVTGSFKALVNDLSQTYPRVSVSGPDLTIPENAMVSLSLVLNELATNAAKYGALAERDGEVDIKWDVEAGKETEMVKLIWLEKGGPLITESPSNSGFGSSLIDHSITRNLHGSIERDWTPDGLVCTVTFPKPNGTT